MDDTTTSIDELRAELDIRRLVAEVAFQADSGALDDYLALYSDDAIWEMTANEALGLPAARCCGHDEIAASVRSRRGIGVQGPGSGSAHHITTQRIDVDGDDATGHIYYQFALPVDGRIAVTTFGQYHDRYRRTPTGWKLAQRTIVIG